MRGVPLRARKPSSRSTSGFSERPTITGPPTPDCSICVRRRISARISRSPSSASAISRARIRSGEKISASTGSLAMRVAERRPAGELRQFAKERARAECVKVLALAVRVVAVNVNLAAENDGEAEADFADRLPAPRPWRSGAPRRSAEARSISVASSCGKIWSRRVSMIEGLELTHIGTFWCGWRPAEFTACSAPARLTREH